MAYYCKQCGQESAQQFEDNLCDECWEINQQDAQN